MRYTLLIITLILFSAGTKAQDYDHAFGYKGGFSYGIAYKMYMDDEVAFETTMGFRFRGVHFGIYKLKHKPANWRKSDKLFLYTGYGAHTGFYNRYDGYNFFSPFYQPVKINKTYAVVGLDGVIGAEYRFLRFPLMISAEFNPFFDLFGPNYFNIHLTNFAFSAKYTF